MPIDLSPSGLVEASKCYCYPKGLAQRVKIYLYAVITGSELTPAQLAAAAACYCYDAKSAKAVLISELCTRANSVGDSALVTCTGPVLAAAAKCYCFDHPTAERVKIWLLAQLANLGALTPAELAQRAACYCMDDKRVPIYLLCNPQGNEEPEPPGPPVEYACPEQPVVLKAYYKCEENGVHYLADSYAGKTLLSSNGPADPDLVSGVGIINNAVNAIAPNTQFLTATDAAWWVTRSWTVRLWFKNTAAFSSTGPTILWAGNKFMLQHAGTAWVMARYTNTWVDYVGGAPGASVPDNEWYRVTAWYCHVSGDCGIQINNNAPVLGQWPTGLGLFANYFEVILTKPIGQTGNGFIDEIAFWTGVLTDAQRLTDWNGGGRSELSSRAGTYRSTAEYSD